MGGGAINYQSERERERERKKARIELGKSGELGKVRLGRKRWKGFSTEGLTGANCLVVVGTKTFPVRR